MGTHETSYKVKGNLTIQIVRKNIRECHKAEHRQKIAANEYIGELTQFCIHCRTVWTTEKLL